jgi:hypothetical protein
VAEELSSLPVLLPVLPRAGVELSSMPMLPMLPLLQLLVRWLGQERTPGSVIQPVAREPDWEHEQRRGPGLLMTNPRLWEQRRAAG